MCCCLFMDDEYYYLKSFLYMLKLSHCMYGYFYLNSMLKVKAGARILIPDLNEGFGRKNDNFCV